MGQYLTLMLCVCVFVCLLQYVGSLDVPRPNSRMEIVAAMRRIRVRAKDSVILCLSLEAKTHTHRLIHSSVCESSGEWALMEDRNYLYNNRRIAHTVEKKEHAVVRRYLFRGGSDACGARTACHGFWRGKTMQGWKSKRAEVDCVALFAVSLCLFEKWGGSVYMHVVTAFEQTQSEAFDFCILLSG